MPRILFAVVGSIVQTTAQLTFGTLVCKLAGHQPSWRLGVACGLDRPICERCSAQL